MSAPQIRGWCPGAHRPMMSGDGLILRIKPFRGLLTAAQVLTLCSLSIRYGSGLLDLTSRANLQIRGVSPSSLAPLLEALTEAGLVDADPGIEARRNILCPPDLTPGDLTCRLHDAILRALPDLPDLPGKMGIALDTGAEATLSDASADFRYELDETGGLILRADGAHKGRPIAEAEGIPALLAMAEWFVTTSGRDAGRMSRHLRHATLPPEWHTATPRTQTRTPRPGPVAQGTILGAPFGQIEAAALCDLIRSSGTTTLRPMPGRLFLLDARIAEAPGLVTDPDSPLLQIHACPGAPYCPQASTPTRDLAARLAPTVTAPLHVSGCAKGCAHPRAAAVTLTGRDGRFDLIRDGAAWDVPTVRDLDPARIDDFGELHAL